MTTDKVKSRVDFITPVVQQASRARRFTTSRFHFQLLYTSSDTLAKICMPQYWFFVFGVDMGWSRDNGAGSSVKLISRVPTLLCNAHPLYYTTISIIIHLFNYSHSQYYCVIWSCILTPFEETIHDLYCYSVSIWILYWLYNVLFEMHTLIKIFFLNICIWYLL